YAALSHRAAPLRPHRKPEGPGAARGLAGRPQTVCGCPAEGSQAGTVRRLVPSRRGRNEPRGMIRGDFAPPLAAHGRVRRKGKTEEGKAASGRRYGQTTFLLLSITIAVARLACDMRTTVSAREALGSIWLNFMSCSVRPAALAAPSYANWRRGDFPHAPLDERMFSSRMGWTTSGATRRTDPPCAGCARERPS